MNNNMNSVTKKLLELVADYKGSFNGAYNIRQNGDCIAQQSSKNILIESKQEKSGINVTVLPGTKGETIYIPACVTAGGMDDFAYNDFFIGEDCDIKIVSGCGVHTEDSSQVRHSGVHRFFVGKNAHVLYEEKHIGTGLGSGHHIINPMTDAVLEEGAYFEINSTQISGVDRAYRKTNATVAKDAHFIVHERLFTELEQRTETKFKVELNGDGSSADVVSRSVARDQSHQVMDSVIIGSAACTGHSECDSIIDGDAIVDASPRLFARSKEASLIHEAAIGKIAGEQILKLRTLGLTEEQAEKEIIEGFLA